MAKTVVGLFDSYAEAQSVVQDLMDSGFQRDDISVVSNDSTQVGDRQRMVGEGEGESAAAEGAGTGAVGGTVLGGALGLLVGAGLLAIPGIGPVLAAGPLAAAIGSGAAMAGAGALGAGIGAATGGLLGGLVGSGIPKEDAEYYAEGVRRGGTLVTVSADDSMAGTAHDILMRHNAVDIEDRSSQWRSSGWTGFDENAPMQDSFTDRPAISVDNSASTLTGTDTIDTTRGSSFDTTTRGSGMRSDSRDDADVVLPVIEEEIDVSKRQVETGGVRVSSRVEERPVEEQVSLREEHVNVERRAVDRPVTDADAAAFQESSFEMRETAEEPVVRKRARVVEEVVIDKDVTEHTETVRDSVRRTDVSVEQTGASTMRDSSLTDSSSMNTSSTAGIGSSMNTGSTMGVAYDSYDNDYRDHYQRTFSSAGYTYDDYKPVYQYGYSLANDQRYSGRDWTDFEGDARTRWEEHNPGTWEQFKESVRYAWDKARGKR